MAVLTSSNVRLIRAWTEGGTTGKRRKVRMVEVHGGSWGGEVNSIPATAFGLHAVEETSVVYYGVPKTARVTTPNEDGSTVFFMDGVGAGSKPADLTLGATPNGGYFTVKGY